MIKEYSDNFIELDDGTIHYIKWENSNKCAHFFHANGFSAGIYIPFLKCLSEHFCVIASDARGHGDTTLIHSRRLKNWHIFVDDLKKFIEKIYDKPIIGIGHSLGAVSTYIAASLYPHLFSSIILIEPVILPKKILFLTALMKFFGIQGNISIAKNARRRKRIFDSKNQAGKRFSEGRGMFKTWRKEFIEAYLEYGLKIIDDGKVVLKCDPETEAQIYESVPIDIYKYGKNIKCPVLVIRGEKSDTFLEGPANYLESVIPLYNLVVMPDTTHFVLMEKPEECIKLILNFLNNKDNICY